MLKNFYLFRHGQSSYNLAGKLQGQSNDSVLTDKGIEQAFHAASCLQDKKIDVIISSPQRRAKQTGSIVARKLNTPIQYDSRLSEANLGSFDGALINKLSKKHRQLLADWNSSQTDARFQNGESKSEIRRRMLSALKEYADSPYQNIAISGHNFSMIEALQSINSSKQRI